MNRPRFALPAADFPDRFVAMNTARVPPANMLGQETFIRHMELRHADSLKLDFKSLPGRAGQPRSLAAPIAWQTFHDRLHVQAEKEGVTLDHFHGVPDASPPRRGGPLAIESKPGSCRLEFEVGRGGHPSGIYCHTHEKRGDVKWERPKRTKPSAGRG